VVAVVLLNFACRLRRRRSGNGAGIGALGEAAAGGIIGATVGAPGVGAAVGGALRLGAQC